MTTTAAPRTDNESLARRDAIYRDGVVGLPGSFPPEWAQQLRADYEPLMQLARSYPGGTVGRGPHRFYHAVQAERLSGFLDVVTHPAVTGLCEAMLGEDYAIVEIGFDTPFPGAKNQPWHRDFPMTSETRVGRWLSSMAFNITTVDVTDENGPFEIVPGTHWEDGAEFEHGMFPPRDTWPGYLERRSPRYPQLGDMSARTGLAIHRGTDHHGRAPRPVLIVGVVAAIVQPAAGHRLEMTRDYVAALPEAVRTHLRVQLVDRLSERPEQGHDIEGLKMGAEDGS